MKRFFTTVCILTIIIPLKINFGLACQAAEGYKSTGSYKGAEGYNGAGVTQSSGGSQNSPATQNSNNSGNANSSDETSDDGQLTPQEQNQIMQNAQKWFNENPEQAKILNQLLQNP